eukprot:11034144-Lingulodinium_polyedra.AAC.1
MDTQPARNTAVSVATSHPGMDTPRCTVDATLAAALGVSVATMSVPTDDHMKRPNTPKMGQANQGQKMEKFRVSKTI